MSTFTRTIQVQTRKIIFFVVCIKVNKQVIECFCLHLFSLTNFFENKITIFTLDQNSIREPRRKGAVGVREAAGVLIIRRRNNYTRGRASQNFLNFFKKISQCRKLSHSAENTLFHILIHALPILIHASPILIHWLGFRFSAPHLNTCIAYLKTLSRLSAPYLNTCIAYLNILSRLSAPYLNTCIFYPNTLRRLHILIHAILIHWVGLRLLAPYLNTCPN